MPFYLDTFVKRVRDARVGGRSIKSLARDFRLPYSTVARWVNDIDSPNVQFRRARAKDEQRKNQLKYVAREFRLTRKSAQLFAALLYWCEGSKYPASNFLHFANSDWRMASAFLELLRRGFQIDETKLRIHLQIHQTHNYKDLVRFWSTLLRVPATRFYKPTITKPTGRSKRRTYLGTCTIKYFDVTLLLGITGIYEGFAERVGRVAERSKAAHC